MTATAVAGAILAAAPTYSPASDHLDSPTTVANPAADITDVFAWMASDGRRLNLVMSVLGHTFSDRVTYVIHVDSGKTFGHTSASTAVVCRFPAPNAANCQLGKIDSVSGDPSGPNGIEGIHHKFRVYAALRDDPFYNNVKGLLGAYAVAGAAIKNGAAVDAAGCALFDEATAKSILHQMAHTDGGAAQNLLYNWTVSAIVVSVDLASVRTGGRMLAVWGSTLIAGKTLDRMGRPFVANTLLGVSPFSSDDASGALRQRFNEATSSSSEFIGDLEKSLAFEDSLDGKCGNQFLAAPETAPSRYRALAQVFADDRLWVNSASTTCTQFFAVELASLGGQERWKNDCGGRAPTYDSANAWRSLLIAGTPSGLTDGLQQDEHPPSATVFPFLAPPDPHAVNH